MAKRAKVKKTKKAKKTKTAASKRSPGTAAGAKSRSVARRPRERAASASKPERPVEGAGSPVRGDGLPVVGMVASAGGLGAFIKFFQAMPPDNGMTFVLIPHLDPHHESMMVELLARRTAMPVREAGDGVRVEANHVYVVPPNKYLSIHDGVLRLAGPLDRGGGPAGLDSFLRSLAEDQQERAIGIILSGTGSHGTLGVKAIKANGGMVVAQAPATADQDFMPRNAIATGLVDYVLAPEEMPEALSNYVKHSFPGAALSPLTRPTPDHLDQLITLLRTRTRFDFRSYRKRMLIRRVSRRMALNHIDDMGAYLAFVRERPEELDQLSKDLLICVTEFLRDPEMFHVLETRVIPQLLRGNSSGESLRVWVPACATGEEAYSMAMLFLEQIGNSGKDCPLQVFATDIEPGAIDMARRGVYADGMLSHVAPKRLSRFFHKLDDYSYQVSKSLRDTVLFAEQNILGDAPFTKLDLVSCRNLLIYLEADVQHKLIQLLHFALNEGGCLVLGSSESVGPHVDLFEPISKKWRIYRRKAALRRPRVEFPIDTRTMHAERRPAGLSRPAQRASLAELTRQALLEDCAPAAVLVESNHQVLYYFGPTAPYLEQASGEPTQDVIVLARKGMATPIRAAIHKALRERVRVEVTSGRVERNGRVVNVRVGARPLALGEGREPAVLLTFHDVAEAKPGSHRKEKKETADEMAVYQLEHELKSTREELQTTIAELETANEELKASNEEVMSMNEELQSANEELETSKEELQSLNEELSTVNNQLHEKIDQLETINNDMVNLLASTDTATVFLGTDSSIKRFTPAATRLFRVISTDVGRPLGDIKWQFNDADLGPDVHAALTTLQPREKEVETHGGDWYLRRITPYRTTDNRIDGVVITLTDITVLKQAQNALRTLNTELEDRVIERAGELAAERNFMAAVLETVGSLIMVLDADGRIVRFNKTCEAASGYAARQVVGKRLSDLGLVPLDEIDAVARAFALLRAGTQLVRHDNHWRHHDGSLRLISWTDTSLRDDQGGVEFIVGTGIDITEQRRAEEQARERLSELAHLHRVYTAGEFAALVAHEVSQPLSAISSYTEASLQGLRRGQLAPEDLRQDLEQIALQAQRAAQTIRELRNFLARREREHERVDLNELVRTAAGLLEPEAAMRKITLELDLAPGPLMVMAAPVQIEHVLVNVVQNAIDAIAAGDRAGGRVTVRTAPDGAMGRVSVQDNGPGFGDEDPERLFTRFFSTKPEGLGMGLAICRAVIDGYDGRIWAERQGKDGGLFHFTVPLAP